MAECVTVPRVVEESTAGRLLFLRIKIPKRDWRGEGENKKMHDESREK